MDKNELRNTIKKLRLQHKMTQKEFALKVGTTDAQINRLEKGERDLSLEWIERIARAFSLNPFSLLSKDWREAPTEPVVELAKNEGDSFSYVDVVDVVASAGAGRLNADFPEVKEQRPFLKSELNLITQTSTEHLKIIVINGDSMEPTLHNNDQVLIDLTQKNVVNDGVYSFCYQGVLLVKRITVDPVRQKLIIKSDNPAYDKIEASPEDVSVAGRVIWIAKRV